MMTKILYTRGDEMRWDEGLQKRWVWRKELKNSSENLKRKTNFKKVSKKEKLKINFIEAWRYSREKYENEIWGGLKVRIRSNVFPHIAIRATHVKS